MKPSDVTPERVKALHGVHAYSLQLQLMEREYRELVDKVMFKTCVSRTKNRIFNALVNRPDYKHAVY